MSERAGKFIVFSSAYHLKDGNVCASVGSSNWMHGFQQLKENKRVELKKNKVNLLKGFYFKALGIHHSEMSLI